MAVNKTSLKSQIRDHRKDNLLRYSVSVDNLSDFVNFAEQLLGSVEMARIRESQGTVKIVMRVGDEIVTILKKLEKKDPYKCSLLTKVLGRLYHNLHVMKYMLAENKLGSQCKKVKKKSAKERRGILDKRTHSIFSKNSNQIRYESGFSRSKQRSSMFEVCKSGKQEKNVDNCKGEVSNSKVLASNSVKVSSGSHKIQTRSGISPILTGHSPSDVEPGTYTEKEPILINDCFQIIPEMTAEDSDFYQFGSNDDLINTRDYTRSANDTNCSKIESQECATRIENTGTSICYLEGQKYINEECVPSGSSMAFDHPLNKSKNRMNGLELVAVGGETINLPLGETIQVFSETGYFTESIENLKEKVWVEISENANASSSYISGAEHTASLGYVSGQIQSIQPQSLECCETGNFCHIEHDSKSGKTFFSL